MIKTNNLMFFIIQNYIIHIFFIYTPLVKISMDNFLDEKNIFIVKYYSKTIDLNYEKLATL